MSGDPFMAELRRLQEENRALQAKFNNMTQKHDELGAILVAAKVKTQTIQRDIIHPKIAELQAKLDDMIRRNQILRTRTDLPMTDPQKETFRQLEAKLAVLEESIAMTNHECHERGVRIVEQQQRITELEAREANTMAVAGEAAQRITALEEALKPFAVVANLLPAEATDDLKVVIAWPHAQITVGELRQAQHALRSIPRKEDPNQANEHGHK